MEPSPELYKIRSLGERFSATADFVRANRKLALRNLLPAGLLLVVLTSLFGHRYIQGVFAQIALAQMGLPVDPFSINWLVYGGMILSSVLLQLYLYAFSGAFLYHYAAGRLTPETTWNELRTTFFSIVRRLLVQFGIVLLLVVAVGGLAALLTAIVAGGGSPTEAGRVLVVVVLPILVGIIALIPSLSLMQYPVYLERTSAWKGIRKGFRWGFRHWGSTFATVLLWVLITMVVSYIAAMPYLVYLMFNAASVGWTGLLFFLLCQGVLLFFTPVCVVFMAFQYTSIAEKEKRGKA
jgi:hypothetical protein